MWKRASAFVLDLIFICIIAAGAMLGLSAITGYDTHSSKLDAFYEDYGAKITEEYGIEDLYITQEEYEAMTEEEQKNHNAAVKAFEAALNKDEEVIATYQLVVSLSLMITSIGIFVGFAALELVVPLILGNGQTIGKKIFGLCVVRVDSVKITPLMLFVRSLLGKYTVETMIPVLIIVMILLNTMGFVGIAVIVMLAILQLALVFATRNHTAIHDAFAQTVVVDMASQMIFNSTEELTAYKARVAAEAAERQSY